MLDVTLAFDETSQLRSSVFIAHNPFPLQGAPTPALAFVDLYTSGASSTWEFVLLIFICLLCAGKNSL